jgi:hypothetical protein
MSCMTSDEQMLMRIEFGVVMSPMHAWRCRRSWRIFAFWPSEAGRACGGRTCVDGARWNRE